MRFGLLLWVIGGLVGCSDGPVSIPVRPIDAGMVVPRDAETTPDSGEPVADAGQPDSGVETDSGFVDGGEVPDGGDVVDGGDPVDGGNEPDGGVVDGGDEPDGGVVVPDTGFPDAGDPDAGTPDPDAGLTDAAGPPPSSWTRVNVDNTFEHGQSVMFVDIDEDGDQDILTSISLTDTVRLHVNGDSNGNGNGTMWTRVPINPPGSIVAMQSAVADFDQDGSLDIATVGFFDPAQRPSLNSPSTAAWYSNPGNVTGTWGSEAIPTAGLSGLRSIAAGDLTGDGLPDLIMGAIAWNGAGQGLRWHRNENVVGARFSAPIDIEDTLQGVELIRVVDVDGNGVDDLVVSAQGAGQMIWYENLRPVGMIQDNPSFARHTMDTLLQSSGFVLVQLDADPAPEVVVAYDDGQTGAVVQLDAPANPRNAWTRTPIGNGVGGGLLDVARVAASDLNQDGRMDFVASSYNQNQVRAFVHNGTDYTAVDVLAVMQPVSIASADATADGYPDIVFTTYENTGTLRPIIDLIDLLITVP